MSPCIIDWKDGALSVLGSGGSNRIRSAILQTILNLVNFGFRPEIAVDLPRLHFENNELSIEGGYEKTRLEEILKDYENRNIWQDKNMFFGGVNLVGFNKSNFYAKADTRREGFDMIVSN
jgi:gamma-glutamyltranspeptidase/glutathione hydrolase